MLARRRRQQTPTFLEGTPGRYLRRESPPRVPSTASAVPYLPHSTLPSANQGPAPPNGSVGAPASSPASSFSNGHLLGPKVRRAKPNKAELSSQSFTAPSNQYVRKTLTGSLSFGNVVQYGLAAELRLDADSKNISLQSLPGRPLAGSSILSESLPGAPSEDLPLPVNWAVEVTPEGYRYYVDHNNRRTHWIHPFAKENLPQGWTKIFDQTHGVVYYNEIENRSQFEHPGLATPATSAPATTSTSAAALHESASFQSIRAETIEDLNIIKEDVPEWLRMYCRAPSDSDHLLNWKLFKLANLDQYEKMVRKLYKQDVIDIVIRYERKRRELNRELNRRLAPAS
uniref:WW domain-containing protein n=1 Tax=Steinernema glaseri TaxID=37863 RepID=A0A1I8A258_9BILA